MVNNHSQFTTHKASCAWRFDEVAKCKLKKKQVPEGTCAYISSAFYKQKPGQ
jgi:hypothetical protein